MLILGIETSCDETSAALLADGARVLSNVVASQVELHSGYGGVVPEIAARAHVESIVPVLERALAGSDRLPDVVAVTVGPGLVGSLVVGVSAAKGLAWSWGVPVVAVNHVQAHAFAPLCEGVDLIFPFLALVVSGGHTLLARIDGVDSIGIVGETRDDALGEAYDKVSKYLGLGYPGGPVIDSLSRSGNPRAVPFPRPMMGSGDYDFSFSGLKTAVVRYVEKQTAGGAEVAPADIVASFQAAALEVVVGKTVDAAMELGLDRVVAGGGVACNGALRSMLADACAEQGIELILPSPALCTDNAAMVAVRGFQLFVAGFISGLDLDVQPNLRPGSNP